jgi:hypothetical protein
VALTPESEQHLLQIVAGTGGRSRGHKFEKDLRDQINSLRVDSVSWNDNVSGFMVTGHPAREILAFIARDQALEAIVGIEAWWLGGLKTARAGDAVTDEAGNTITGSKSDILVEFRHAAGVTRYGISVKKCNNAKATNAQVYCTTASAFCAQLRSIGIDVSDVAEMSLRMYCGDPGFRPKDGIGREDVRVSDDRWFWEELSQNARDEWEHIFSLHQDTITRFLLKFAYPNDPFPPAFLMHQAVGFNTIEEVSLAIFDIEKLVQYSSKYGGFSTKAKRVIKGTFSQDPNLHAYPRFGFIQFQPIGNRQNKHQLQFNLQAGYFYKIPPDAELLVEDSPND